MEAGGTYKYKDTAPIHPYQTTVWMVEFEGGAKQLNVCHKDIKIEDVVEAVKLKHKDIRFTVATVDEGIFCLYQTGMCASRGRRLNQDMEVV